MPKKIPTRRIGRNGPEVGAIGLGAMGIGRWYGSTPSREEAFKTLTYAADRGMNFWDTSNVYGDSEQVIGEWFQTTSRRSEIFLATKFGAFDPSHPQGQTSPPNSTPSHIRTCISLSLSSLQTTYIDLLYQHRVDLTVPIEIVLETLRPYIESGTVKYIGLSECSVETLRRARAVRGVGERVIAVQMEFSVFTLDIERNGFARAADELGVGVVAYSPLSRGLLTGGRFTSRADFDPDDIRLWLPRWSEENFPKNIELVEKISEIAKENGDGNGNGVTTAQIAINWILAEHPGWIPIPGCRSPERVEENAAAAEFTLSAEAVRAIRRLTEEADVAGDRYPPQVVPNEDCIGLSEWKGEGEV